SFSFEPDGIWLFAIVALFFWYRLLIKRSFSQRLITSYFFGLSVLLPTQIWTGTYVGNLPWLILCFGQALIFLLPALGEDKGASEREFSEKS
ncbi:MAG: apolipoprotein N-acyltransferase, partial [Bacteroidota bacterium]